MLPPQDVFDPSIVTACNQLYAKGDALIQQGAERLLQQRVTVTEVPCAKAFGNYKVRRAASGCWETTARATAPTTRRISMDAL